MATDLQYMNLQLFRSYDSDIRGACEGTVKVGTLNGVHVRSLSRKALHGLANDIKTCSKKMTICKGLAAVIIVASVATLIFSMMGLWFCIAGGIGIAGLALYHFYLKKKVVILKTDYTKQRVIDAQAFLSLGPIGAMERKIGLLPPGSTAEQIFQELDLVQQLQGRILNAAIDPKQAVINFIQTQDDIFFQMKQETVNMWAMHSSNGVSVQGNRRSLENLVDIWFKGDLGLPKFFLKTVSSFGGELDPMFDKVYRNN